jgi:small subunit ribosomal protein S16
MVVIRLARVGAKKRPFYHVVAIDRRHARNSGNYIERLGYFNPMARGAEVRLHLDHDKINHWVSVGAQLSDRVSSLTCEAKKVALGQPSSVAKRKTKRADKKLKAAEQKQKEASTKESAV